MRWFAHCIACWMILSCQVVALGVGEAEENLVTNASVEKVQGEVPLGWRAVGEECAYEKDVAHTGHRSLCIMKPHPRPHYWLSDPIPIDPRCAYEFGGWIKTDGVSNDWSAWAKIDLQVFNSAGKLVRTFSTVFVMGTRDWLLRGRRILPDQLPKTARTARLRCVLVGDGPGRAYFDDLFLKPIPFTLKITTPQFGNLFEPGEDVKFTVSISHSVAQSRKMRLSVTVHDYWRRMVKAFQRSVHLEGVGTLRKQFEFNPTRKGFFSVRAQLLGGDERAVAECETGIAVLSKEPLPAGENPLGINRVGLRLEHLPLVVRAGIGWLRLPVCWNAVEPERGKFRFPDRWVEASTKYGLKILGILGYSAPWASSAPASVTARGDRAFYPPADLKLWAQYVAKTVAHYKRTIRHWEVWNEPDTAFFKGTGKQFAQVLTTAYRSAKSVDPHCVVMFDSAWVSRSFFEAVFLAGATHAWDVLAAHNYQLAHSEPLDLTPFEEKYQGMRAVLRDWGREDAPIWDTEFCVLSRPLDHCPGLRKGERQAAQLIRAYILARVNGVEKLFWYPFCEYPHTRGRAGVMHSGGLMRADATPKPAYVAMHTLSKFLPASKYVRRFAAPRDVRVEMFTRGATPWLVAWCITGKAKLPIVVKGKRFVVTDIMDNDRTFTVNQPVTFVQVDKDPIFIHGAKEFVEPVRLDVKVVTTDVSAPQRISVSIRNNTSVSLRVRVRLADDLGYVRGVEFDELKLAPGQTVRVPVRIYMPPLGDEDWQMVAHVVSSQPRFELERRISVRVTPTILCPHLARAVRIDGDLCDWDTLAGTVRTKYACKAFLARTNSHLLIGLRVRRAGISLGELAIDGRRVRLQVAHAGEDWEASVPLVDAFGVTPKLGRAVRLEIRSGQGEVLWRGRAIFSWQAPHGTMPQVFVNSLPEPMRARGILTMFPPRLAYMYELFVSSELQPGRKFDGREWVRVSRMKIGRGLEVARLPREMVVRHIAIRFVNLIHNGGFEAPIQVTASGSERSPAEFFTWQSDRNYNEIVTDEPRSGNRCAFIPARGRTRASMWSNWFQTIPVRGDTSYTITMYVRVAPRREGEERGARAQLAFHALPKDRYEILTRGPVPATEGVHGWQRLTKTIRTHPDARRLRVFCSVCLNRTAWFDDMMVIEGTTPTDLPAVVWQRAEP